MQRIFWLSMLAPLAGMAQQYGIPPVAGLSATDLSSAFQLPPLGDSAGSPVENILADLQVGKRAAALGITSGSATDAWKGAQFLLAARGGSLPVRGLPNISPVMFTGGTASALNTFMAQAGNASIKVTSAVLTVDQPIEIRRNGVTLDFASAQLVGTGFVPYMVRVEGANDVTLLRGDFVGGDSGVLVSASNAVTVSGLRIEGLSGAGILVTGSTHVTISGNRISGVGLAGIMIHRGTSESVVQNNQVSGGTGFANQMAGIVLTDREVDLTSNPRAIFGPNGYWAVEQPMLQRMNPPHDNAIVGNQVTKNNSSGIYVDGTVRNVIASNTILSNAKEGLCLDNGAAANVVTGNEIEANGDRWGEPDTILSSEFILGGGRLADGTPAEKVPGISVDNALYNIVFANNVTHNYGGGIKIVRTGYFNLIGMNTLFSDNDGASDTQHFFGIELGAAAGDGASAELDFTPSHGNIVFSNNIRGNHFSGIFFDSGSDQNTVLNNVIFDAQAWALESSQQMRNSSVDNLTNLPSRNIGSGLDQALVMSGQPVNDPPPM